MQIVKSTKPTRLSPEELKAQYEIIKEKLQASTIPVTLSISGGQIIMEFGFRWPVEILDQVENILGEYSQGVQYCALYSSEDRTETIEINGGSKDYPLYRRTLKSRR